MKVAQHIIASIIVGVVIILMCIMFGEPNEQLSMFTRFVIGFAGVALLWRICKILNAAGLLPELEDNYNDNF